MLHSHVFILGPCSTGNHIKTNVTRCLNSFVEEGEVFADIENLYTSSLWYKSSVININYNIFS